jgi:LDH2 family malate/lactate/ureidoglycolate dehydrogenase
MAGAHSSHEASSLSDDLGGPPRLGQTVIAIYPGGAGFAERIEGLLSDMAAEPGVRIPGDRRHDNRRRAEVEGGVWSKVRCSVSCATWGGGCDAAGRGLSDVRPPGASPGL